MGLRDNILSSLLRAGLEISQSLIEAQASDRKRPKAKSGNPPPRARGKSKGSPASKDGVKDR